MKVGTSVEFSKKEHCLLQFTGIDQVQVAYYAPVSLSVKWEVAYFFTVSWVYNEENQSLSVIVKVWIAEADRPGFTPTS